MQILSVNGFLGISDATIRVDGLTTLIGAQASGKSVVARLFYFFNEYFADFDELALLNSEHKKSYDSGKKKDFYKIFPTYSWHDDAFEIIFQLREHSITLRSVRNSSSIDLISSPSVAKYFRDLKSDFSNFKKAFPTDDLRSPTRMLRDFRNKVLENGVRRHERTLFVPASRSFYSTIRQEIFSILSIDEKIDRIIMQFGEFYESAKFAISYMEERRDKSKRSAVFAGDEYFSSIVKGRYVRSDNRDWIEMRRGRIEVSKASSGQQEALPLLVALQRFPASGRTLIIEEPEAHLFPTSQVKILEYIVRQCVLRETNILFTTHSPYMLSALNNYILKGLVGKSSGIPADRVHAYSLEEGRTNSIIDPDTKLVSAEYIDSVSETITSEFIGLLEDFND